MSISPYVRALRARVGPMRLLLPSVSVHVFDAAGRMLLVRHREGGVWSTPGGMIEPDERPADAAVREAWEETGLLVRPERLLAVYGGPECVVRYANGDEAQYVVTAFGCAVAGGAPRPDGEETVEVRYWSEAEARGLPLAPWLRALLPLVYAGPRGEQFAPASWAPTAPADQGARAPAT
jgi:ADP-ribose pyrophosphatase YjhB (NUDIX family)